jgi:WD40 repeat protein
MKFPLTCPALSALAFAALLSSTVHAQGTERVSVNSAGSESFFFPFEDPAISADGQFVAFVSKDFGMVAGDTNGVSDIFVRDRAAGLTTRVSVDSAGLESNSTSFRPDISGDGRFVTFASYATNLVAGDTNGVPDIFLHDRLTGMTTRVSVDSAGAQANSASEKAEISADGTTIAIISYASNLVAGDANNDWDVFAHDIASGATTMVSVSSGGVQSNGQSGNFFPDISADGRFVAFDCTASNLVAGDTNNQWDVFVHDRLTGTTSRVSVATGGAEASNASIYPSISDDGNVVGFYSFASDLVAGDTNAAQDCFVHNRTTGVTTRVSVSSAGVEGIWDSSLPVVSGDGSAVIFFSASTNLVAGDTNGFGDIFLHEIATGTTTIASLADSGGQGNGQPANSDISATGQYVAFASNADNLVVGDANGIRDVFVRDRGSVSTGPSLAVSGVCGGMMTFDVSNASPGGVVAYVSGPPGVWVKVGGACSGLVLAVNPPTIRASIVANAAGETTLVQFVPAGACGLGVQAVDAATCTPTGMVVL